VENPKASPSPVVKREKKMAKSFPTVGSETPINQMGEIDPQKELE